MGMGNVAPAPTSWTWTSAGTPPLPLPPLSDLLQEVPAKPKAAAAARQATDLRTARKVETVSDNLIARFLQKRVPRSYRVSRKRTERQPGEQCEPDRRAIKARRRAEPMSQLRINRS